jgi:hypothetical protein
MRALSQNDHDCLVKVDLLAELHQEVVDVVGQQEQYMSNTK